MQDIELTEHKISILSKFNKNQRFLVKKKKEKKVRSYVHDPTHIPLVNVLPIIKA